MENLKSSKEIKIDSHAAFQELIQVYVDKTRGPKLIKNYIYFM